MAKEGGGIKNITQSGSGNAVTNMALSSDGKTITAVFGETFARQQDFGTLNNTVTQLSNKLNNFLEGSDADNIINKWKELEAFLDGLTESDNLADLLALKADKTITISAGAGLTGGGNLSANRTISLATSGVKAGTYTKVTVDTYGRVTVGDNPTTLAGYGITDAVTLTTAQTISGQKTFTKNILMNSGTGLSYDENTVFRNTSGNTIIASYGDGMIYFRPNGHNNTEGAVWISKTGYLNGVSAGFTGGVSAARLTANEYIQIGDAQLVYDSANKALRVKHRTDGNTVGFYSDGWVSALGVKTGGSGGGSGVVNTVYSFANLTDGTTFSDSDLDNTFNAYTIKKLYDMAGQGGLDADAMWAELKKADSSKIIDASHIPTSVLDGRWVKKTGDTMTGALTSASSSGSIVFKGVENCDITNIYKDNGVIRNDDGGLTSIRNGLRFNWYDTYWYIGNLRGSSTDSAGFGVVDHNNKLVLRVTPNDVRAPRFMSTVATGVSPLIVSSNTLVNNLNADLLDGYHQSKFLRTDGVNQHVTLTGGDGNTEGYRLVLEATVPGGWSVNSMTLLVNSRHAGTGTISLVFHTTNKESTSYEGSLNYYGSTTQHGGTTMWRLFYNTTTKKIRLFWHYYDYNDCQVSILNRRGVTTNISDGTWYTTLPSDNGNELPSYYNRSDTTGSLATSRTLWGQPFNGTANVSGDMTGVGTITMSGDLKIGNGTSPNAILFYGTTGDNPRGYDHTFIAERLWGGTESSELVLFKGNDLGNGNEAVNVHASGPDRIRHIAAAHLFQTYTSALSGPVEDVCTSSALKNLFGIAANRVTSYVPFMSTVASGTAPFIVVSSTVVGNLNADMVDGLHLSDFDGRYVNVTGDTMTGDLAMDTNKGFYIPHGTRVVKTSGNWIHGGGDTASSTDANLRFGSWYGIGWYPSFSGGSVAQGKNAMWLDVRTGVLDVHSNITSHNGYLAANWDSARRLVLGGGSSYVWIDLRNSSNNSILNNIILYDGYTETTKEMRAPYFKSIVGTGAAPYQCLSTTLNANLNADLLDGQHGAFYQNRTFDNYVHQYNEYDYIEFLRFVIPSGKTELAAHVIFDLCRVETGGAMSGRAVLRIRRSSNNNADYIFYVTNFGHSWLPELRCTTNDGITWRVWMKCTKTAYDPYIMVKIVEEYPYGSVTTQNNGTTGTPSGSKYTVVAGTAGLSNAANIWTNARMFYIQDHNASHTGAGVSVNGSANVYLKLPNSIQCSDWFRSTGNSGWYHQDYGGGWYMQDSTYIRNYGSKRLRIQTDTYDTLQLVRSSDSGGSSITFYNGGGTFRGQLGVNASSWFSFDTGTATANQNVVEISPAGGIHSKAEITAKASGSDIRLKKDIQNYNAMNIINKFRSVKYHWNDIAKANSEVYNNDYDQFGLIAQDLIAGGFGQWVRDVFHDYYTVTYERLIPVVWKGLQEVDDEVTRLKKRVRELEKRLGINN